MKGKKLVKQGLAEVYQKYSSRNYRIIEREGMLDDKTSNNCSIEWESSRPEYINEWGDIHRPSFTAGNVLVELTAHVSYESFRDSIKVFVTIPKQDPTELDALTITKDTLSIQYSKGDHKNCVTSKVHLPRFGKLGAFVKWTSSHPEYVSCEGKVSRPRFYENDLRVLLTATIISGDFFDEKCFLVNVAKQKSEEDRVVN